MSLQEHQAEESSDQTEPLLPTTPPRDYNTPRPRDSDSSMAAIKSNSLSNPSALGLQGLAVAFIALIWALVFQRLPGGLFSLPLFGYHPLLQSLSVLLLAQSILVLQPTSQSRPKEKKAAFNVHQIVNAVLVLPILTVGASIMFYLHHPNSHFISWHGILGTAILVWMWLQAALGAASVWGNGRLLGGEAKAKGWWKWHRLSGYILLPAFFFNLFLGATQTTWTQQNASQGHHFAVGAVMLGIVVAGAWRVQGNKLPGLRFSGRS